MELGQVWLGRKRDGDPLYGADFLLRHLAIGTARHCGIHVSVASRCPIGDCLRANSSLIQELVECHVCGRLVTSGGILRVQS